MSRVVHVGGPIQARRITDYLRRFIIAERTGAINTAPFHIDLVTLAGDLDMEKRVAQQILPTITELKFRVVVKGAPVGYRVYSLEYQKGGRQPNREYQRARVNIELTEHTA